MSETTTTKKQKTPKYATNKYDLFDFLKYVMPDANNAFLQTLIYITWGEYQALHYLMNHNGMKTKMPKYLFKPNFHAGPFGPFDPDLLNYQAKHEVNVHFEINMDNEILKEHLRDIIIDHPVELYDNFDTEELAHEIQKDVVWQAKYQETNPSQAMTLSDLNSPYQAKEQEV